MAELVLAGHSNEWVAIIDDKIIAANKSFEALVKELGKQNLLKKALITKISGAYAVL